MTWLDRENGKRVYYEDYGHGDSAVLLLHGWGMSLRTWDHVLPALHAAGHRVVLMDHRGCGESDKDFADMSLQAIADDAVVLVQALQLQQVVLNGWSLGGAVATEAAHQLGPVCKALVLTCGASPAYLQKPDFPYGGTTEALAETMAALAADRVNFLAGLSQGICATDVGDSIINWMWQIFMQASPLAAQSLADLGPLDQREILSALRIPILSFVGGQDAVCDPAIGRAVASLNSGAKVVEFEGAGHAPFIDEREAYLRELMTFLTDIDAS